MAIEESGFNPSIALNDIINAGNQMKEIAGKLEEAGADLFTSLRDNWASPKAQEFSSQWSKRLYDITVNSVLSTANSFVAILTEAYNIMASNQNYPNIEQPIVFTIGESIFEMLNEKDPNGNVGMNTSVVKRAMQTYKQIVSTVINLLHNMNITLAILDHTGEVARELKQSANAIADEIEQIVSAIGNQIEAVTETEADTIITAVSETASTVGSAGSRTPSTISPLPGGHPTGGFVPNKPTEPSTISPLPGEHPTGGLMPRDPSTQRPGYNPQHPGYNPQGGNRITPL